jgi:5-methylthioribose kinase
LLCLKSRLAFYKQIFVYTIHRYLPTPYAVLRGLLIERKRVENLGKQVGLFVAESLTRTTTFGGFVGERRATLLQQFAGNHAMCSITDNVIFKEPFLSNIAHNRHSKQVGFIIIIFYFCDV